MSFEPFNWECPHCGAKQTVTEPHYQFDHVHLSINNLSDGSVGLQIRAIGCANRECRKLVVHAAVMQDYFDRFNSAYKKKDKGSLIFAARLIPDSSAKSQPEYIPEALRDDYTEACRIRDLSPKASATLSRRCLQGMIRDFCDIRKETLYAEINALKELVEADKAPSGVSLDSVEAIDHVRSVGNIGAHMEKDINHIVPVDPQEAQLLIELIESLFEEWYVAREKRAARFLGIKALAESKKKLIADLKASQIDGAKE